MHADKHSHTCDGNDAANVVFDIVFVMWAWHLEYHCWIDAAQRYSPVIFFYSALSLLSFICFSSPFLWSLVFLSVDCQPSLPALLCVCCPRYPGVCCPRYPTGFFHTSGTKHSHPDFLDSLSLSLSLSLSVSVSFKIVWSCFPYAVVLFVSPFSVICITPLLFAFEGFYYSII